MLSDHRVKQVETLLAAGVSRRQITHRTGVRHGLVAAIEAGEQPRCRLEVADPETGQRVRAAAERYFRQHRGRPPERPRVEPDPVDAYLPSSEEIAAACERLRARHLAELV